MTDARSGLVIAQRIESFDAKGVIEAYTWTKGGGADWLQLRVFPITEQTVEVSLKRYAKRVGIEDWNRVTPTRLRAFFATDARDSGFDAFMVRDLMRHKNVNTTNSYVGRATPSQVSEAMERLVN